MRFVRNLPFSLYLFSCFVFCTSRLLMAQTETAAISGHIVDSSGAIVGGAEVELRSIQRGTSSTASTNEAGIYIFPSVQPGQYSVTVRKQGFKQVDLVGVVANVQDHIEQNFRLELGSVSESVTVSADQNNINTTDASVSTVIDRQFVENLPLNGRSFQSLLYLAPGVAANVPSGSTYYSQGQFVVNGQRGDNNYWTVDGVGANIGIGLVAPGAGLSGAVGATNALGGTNALVSVDALQEFRIETSSYAPEFGRLPGGQVSIQTRSGTNGFHGTLFDYLRNGDLDATDWFADHNGLAKPLEIQNDFGGALGGPVVKNKSFFFFSYEGFRLRLPQTFVGTVPDLASRAAAIPAMKPYLNSYPLPKPGAAPAGDGYVTYSTTYSEPGTADAFSLRIDHQLLKKLGVFARYSHSPSAIDARGAANAAANNFARTKSITKTATVGATWSGFSRMVDDLRFNYSVSGGSTNYLSDNLDGGTPFPTTNLFPAGLSYNNSDVIVLPPFGASMRLFRGVLGNDYQHQYNFVDALSLQRGSHDIKVGVDYRRLLPTADNAYEQIVPLFSTMQEMEQGSPDYTFIYANYPQTFVLSNVGIFAQDSWRVNSRFNMTYGIRWDVDFVPQNSRGFGFAALTGYSTTDLSNLGLAPAGTRPYSTRYGNIAPRIGGAYQISTSPEWGSVVRAGFGIVYGLASTEIFDANYQNTYYPVGATETLTSTPFPTPLDAAALPPLQAPSIGNGGVLSGFDPNLNVPYTLEWNTSFQQSLGREESLTLSYIGASDRRLLLSEFITAPNPQYAYALLVGNAGWSNYQGLQAQFQRRLTGGLQALASYTWSHSIDNGSYGAYSNGGFADPNANRGDSDFDLRNVFSGAITYSPRALSSNPFTRAITENWSTDDIVQLRSGPPLDVQDTNPNFTAITGQSASILIRPDVVPNQPLYLTGTQFPGGRALNPASFTDPPVDPRTGLPLRQGNLSRNARRSRGLAQWDFAVRREFTLYDRMKLQFRAELFNILNHPNFGPYNNQFQTGNLYFGQSTQMLNQYSGGYGAGIGTQNPLYAPGGPRSGEFALKLIF